MRSQPSTPERCRILLSEWRKNLNLTNLEKYQLSGGIKALDRQLKRMNDKCIRIAVFGRVGVGKSSLLNALLRKNSFATDVAHGCTRVTKSMKWKQDINKINSIELVDTPGIDEIEASRRGRLASRIALHSDLVLLVLDSDITFIELKALEILMKSGKPVFIILNRIDQWSKEERKELLNSIKNKLPEKAKDFQIISVAAAPRQAIIQENNKIRSQPCMAIVEALRESLINFLSVNGELLLALNSLRQADNFYNSLKEGRLARGKKAAQSIIGNFAAIKASGVAANPFLFFDLAGGLACDTALVVKLSNLYGLQMQGNAARKILKQLSFHNALLGGAQLGIQLALGGIRQLLILATPFSSGLSLASAAPVALVQAALAIHTTQLTGQLAAQEILKGSQKKIGQPRAMLKRLSSTDPQVKKFLVGWEETSQQEQKRVQALLP